MKSIKAFFLIVFSIFTFSFTTNKTDKLFVNTEKIQKIVNHFTPTIVSSNLQNIQGTSPEEMLVSAQFDTVWPNPAYLYVTFSIYYEEGIRGGIKNKVITYYMPNVVDLFGNPTSSYYLDAYGTFDSSYILILRWDVTFAGN